MSRSLFDDRQPPQIIRRSPPTTSSSYAVGRLIYGYQADVGSLTASGADLLSRADYDPENKEFKLVYMLQGNQGLMIEYIKRNEGVVWRRTLIEDRLILVHYFKYATTLEQDKGDMSCVWGMRPPCMLQQLNFGEVDFIAPCDESGKENCYTLNTDHWSIVDKNGKVLKKTQRQDVPIPRRGPHSMYFIAHDTMVVKEAISALTPPLACLFSH
ncbi:hypothetical protein Tco_0357558 [Tanacetum coccineum]